MVYTGTFDAPKLKRAPSGLFSVADVFNHADTDDDNRWVRGFYQRTTDIPNIVLVSSALNAVTGAQISTDGTPTDYADSIDSKPFFIEAQSTGSGLGAGPDRIEANLAQLEVATQKAVEIELAEGRVSKADNSGNLYLSKNTATVVTTAGKAPEVALQALEDAIANNPFGAAGVIHLTRAVASALGSRLLWKDGKVVTRLGTEVVVGSGYSGLGPTGATGAAPTATNEWIYATGPIVVHLGAKESLNNEAYTGFNSSTNTYQIVSSRPAAVYFDPSTHAAAQVTLPAV